MAWSAGSSGMYSNHQNAFVILQYRYQVGERAGGASCDNKRVYLPPQQKPAIPILLFITSGTGRMILKKWKIRGLQTDWGEKIEKGRKPRIALKVEYGLRTIVSNHEVLDKRKTHYFHGTLGAIMTCNNQLFCPARES